MTLFHTSWTGTSNPYINGTPGSCPWCSNPQAGSLTYHQGPCPRVKSVEYNPDGSIKKVEFRDA